MMGINIIVTGIGFVVPTLAVKEKSSMEEIQVQANHLYFGYFLAGTAAFVLQALFMKVKPQTPSSSAC